MTAAAAAPPPRRAPAAPRSLLLAMDGREDAEYDFQAAFAEARRWLEVRRLSVLLGASPSLSRSLPGPGSRLAPHSRGLPRRRQRLPGRGPKPELFVGSCGLLFLDSVVAICRNLSVQYRHRPLLAIQIKGWLGCPSVVKAYNFLPSCKLLL